MNRRDFLELLGLSAGSTVALHFGQSTAVHALESHRWAIANTAAAIGFKPINFAIPLLTEGRSTTEQIAQHRHFTVQDDFVLPTGFTYDLLAVWGDRLGQSHVGYNNDYLGFVPTGPHTAYLSINFEYISVKPWLEAYPQVMGKPLPIALVMAEMEQAGDAGLSWEQIAANQPLQASIRQISRAALQDLGIGIMSIRQDASGRWIREPSNRDRRINGLSGLENGHYLQSTGPATAVFRKTSAQGYIDGLGTRIIGTFANCAGGTSPWGTIFSAEENFQDLVAEPVYADGSSFAPGVVPFKMNADDLTGCGSAFGLAGNKYGWMVEVDPANPQDYGTKHTWLGRFRHEAVAIHAQAGQPLVMYSGCDRRGGHLYKFVSQGRIANPNDKRNSRLLTAGMLYAAQFQPDGTGRWISLSLDTPIDPVLPSQCAGGMVMLPKRPAGGGVAVKDDGVAIALKEQFATLGDLYQGSAIERQGAILIDAHLAASAAGATCTARPEDTELMADGSLIIAFTSGSTSSQDGSPDRRVFKGPDGKAPYEYGWLMRLEEDRQDASALTFRWRMLATGGEPSFGGLGFSNPDNLAIDPSGNLWMVTDMSAERQNRPIPIDRRDAEGKTISQSSLRAIYGNNSMWFMPTQGPGAGQAVPFAYGPIECELTGPCFTPDGASLLVSVQHPGENRGTRRQSAREVVEIGLTTTDGTAFVQQRSVPIGSNWPDKQPDMPPKPAVVVIRRQDFGRIG
ncbi:MAG: DUF839 domain-containing protein [Oscillatoriales cyanobacterium]|nr:MAG: DUF839 domain-containing protein [Oscillatoriales cyanobacterium]